jgi:DNA-binding response OmpR family regulator
VGRELLARVRALMRWNPAHEAANLPQLRLDLNQKTVFIQQRRIRLTPVEFDLLKFLCDNRPQFFTAVDLLRMLWKYPPQTGDTALVRNHIRNLRCKLESDPERPHVLISQYGRGYSIRAFVQGS